MDHGFYSIVEKLAILEGRIAPKDTKTIVETTTKQKKPALFNNLKKEEKTEEDFTPMVGGVEFAEEKSNDVLSQVKASLADYLKSAEDSIKHDKDLLAKKKEDLDLKKKELKDLELQKKKQEVEEAIPMGLEEAPQLQVGDTIAVSGHNEYHGEFGVVDEFAPSGKFVVIQLRNGDKVPMHISDVELTDDEGWNDNIDIDEDPCQTPAGGEGKATLTDPTYAESITAPVKTVNVPTEEVGLSGGGGSVLVEIHGDERDGFCIKRAGKELPTRFKTLEECEIALEMYMAKQKAKQAAEQSADYIEEK